MRTQVAYFDSPIGRLTIEARGDEVVRLALPEEQNEPGMGAKAGDEVPVIRLARAQLEEYFAGRRREFDLPLALAGTPFQLKVWNALAKIPYGTTTTYAEIARRTGSPKAVRAVGAANGRNPLPIILPCHRVIGSDGTLTGYGGGLPTKKWLLDHERRIAAHTGRGAGDTGSRLR